MKSLFEITQEVMELASLLEEGEITPELEERLAISKEELEEKAINYGRVIKTITSDVGIINCEITRLLALKGAKEKVIDRLKESLANSMKLLHVDKIETPLMKISFRKSEVVEIDLNAFVGGKYIKTKTTESIDKAKIKNDLKNGIEITGAHIVEKQNLQIK